ncbi:MAG: hypothetical protein O7H41_19830 [Planctomycetota bacterium]|nr:hypothetical protein [Planctomycetota bacterium]
MKGMFVFAMALGLAFGGCTEGDHQDGDGHHGSGETVDVPDHYAAAVEKCEELSKKIDDLIAKGDLDDVHAVAANIQKIAEKLSALAKEDLPQEKLRDVNIKSKELAGMFTEIDEAADAGKKQETIQVHDKMRGLIAELKKHVKKVDPHEGHQH